MNNGRGWRSRGVGGPGMWDRGAPPGFRPPPPLFRGGFAPRPPSFYPGAPPPWRGGAQGGQRRGRGGFSPRGGVSKRFGKFGQRGGAANLHAWKNPNKNRKTKDTPGRRLTEEEIGVTEYVSEHEGFNGIIKSRYADFQVSEISERGEVAQLTDTKVPEPPKREEISEDEELLLSKYNLELLPLDTWDKINSLAVCAEPTTERVEVDVTGMSKEDRTKIHDAVKKAFGDAIVGSTVTTSDKKLVRFEKYRKGGMTHSEWLEEQLCRLERRDREREAELFALNVRIEELETQLEENQQSNIQNELVITGVHEAPGESSEHMLTVLATQADLKLQDTDVDFVSRMGPRRHYGAQHPRSIVVRLTRRSLRNQILKAERIRRQFKPEQRWAPSPQVYVNEHLTRSTRMLLQKTRMLARKHGHRFVWVRSGRIYIRRQEGERFERVLSHMDLSRIFNEY